MLFQFDCTDTSVTANVTLVPYSFMHGHDVYFQPLLCLQLIVALVTLVICIFFMFWLFMVCKIIKGCHWVITFVTVVSPSFMFCSGVNCKISFGSCFESTMLTTISNTFMNRLDMIKKIFHNCSFEIAFFTFGKIIGSMLTLQVQSQSLFCLQLFRAETTIKKTGVVLVQAGKLSHVFSVCDLLSLVVGSPWNHKGHTDILCRNAWIGCASSTFLLCWSENHTGHKWIYPFLQSLVRCPVHYFWHPPK